MQITQTEPYTPWKTKWPHIHLTGSVNGEAEPESGQTTFPGSLLGG